MLHCITGWLVPIVRRLSSCLKTYGTNHPVMQRHIPEEWRSQLHCCESLHTQVLNTVQYSAMMQMIKSILVPWLTRFKSCKKCMLFIMESVDKFQRMSKNPCNILNAVRHVNSHCKVTVRITFVIIICKDLFCQSVPAPRFNPELINLLQGLPLLLLPLSENYFNRLVNLLPFFQSTFN
jgi:hypothetical protein